MRILGNAGRVAHPPFAALVVLLVMAALFTSAPSAHPAGTGPEGDVPDTMLGPGEAGVSNMKDTAIIRWSKYGFIYISGLHDNNLRVTYEPATNTLLYHDLATKSLREYPQQRCTKLRARTGIRVRCAIPPRFDTEDMFVQVWPRLGNDHIDGHTLPARFRLWVLADDGDDVIEGGAGDDFVNGAKGRDVVNGHGGDDFIRTGPGRDTLIGESGRDRLSCGENEDQAFGQDADTFVDCEEIVRS